MIQSMMFAKLVVAGHGTIYNTRIDDWFWKKPYPSWILFLATFSTRIAGTLIAVYGLLDSAHRLAICALSLGIGPCLVCFQRGHQDADLQGLAPSRTLCVMLNSAEENNHV